MSWSDEVTVDHHVDFRQILHAIWRFLWCGERESPQDKEEQDENQERSDEGPVDLRLAAPALIAWAVAFGTLAVPLKIAMGAAAVCVVLIATAVKFRRWVIAACGIIAITALGCTSAHVFSVENSPVTLAGQNKSVAAVQLKVISDPHPLSNQFGGGSVSVRTQVSSIEVNNKRWKTRCEAEVIGQGAQKDSVAELAVGERIEITGRAGKPTYNNDNLCAQFTLSEKPDVLARPGFGDRAINAMRAGLRRSMAGAPADQAGLVPSMVVGDVVGLPDDLVQNFKTASLTHLTAVSGSNLTLMLVFFMTLARWVGVRGWALRVLAVVVVGFFVIICRGESSVIRAAAMGLVGLAATGRRGLGPAGLRQLALAIWVVILLDPPMARSWGFALSVCATAGILWWAGRWQKAMGKWAPTWLAESLCVPVAAQLATQPLITILSGQISMVGVIANMAAAPFVGPVTVLGMVAALTSPIFFFPAKLCGLAAGTCVQPVIYVAKVAAELPAATLAWPTQPFAVGLISVVSLFGGMLFGRIAQKPLLCFLLTLGLAVGCWWRPDPIGWPKNWAVMSCDIGQGDATLIRSAAHEAILVDVGPKPDAISQCLRDADVQRISLLVLTHYHDDHVGGLDGVLKNMHIDHALLNAMQSPADAAKQVKQELEKAGAKVDISQGNEHLSIGQAQWETIHAGSANDTNSASSKANADSPEENDSSIVGRVQSGGISTLVTGDIEPAGQRTMMGHPELLVVDVLKVPHHGSARQDQSFISATHAKVALVSVGLKNSYGHPNAKTLDLLESVGMTIVRTDQQGAIALTRDGKGSIHVATRR